MDNSVLETIANLRNSGLSNEEIKSMLKDIGFDEDIINEALKQNVNEKPDNSEKEKPEEDIQNLSPEEKTKINADEAKLASNLAMNVAEMATDKINDHEKVVRNVETKINDLNESIIKMSNNDNLKDIEKMNLNLDSSHKNIDNKLDNIDAKIEVLRKIMQDILENQRDILMRLK